MKKIKSILVILYVCCNILAQENLLILKELDNALFPQIQIDSIKNLNDASDIIKYDNWLNNKPDDRKCRTLFNKIKNCEYSDFVHEITLRRDNFIDSMNLKYTFKINDSVQYNADYEKKYILTPLNNLIEFYIICNEIEDSNDVFRILLNEPCTNQAEKTYLAAIAEKHFVDYLYVYDTTSNKDIKLNLLNYISSIKDPGISDSLIIRIDENTDNTIYLRILNIVSKYDNIKNAKFIFDQFEKSLDSELSYNYLVIMSNMRSIYDLSDICVKFREIGNYYIRHGNITNAYEVINNLISCNNDGQLVLYLFELYENGIMLEKILNRLKYIKETTKDADLKLKIENFIIMNTN